MENQGDFPLISSILPALAQELGDLLVQAGYSQFAAITAELRIVDRCCCGDDFCATFYTQPRPNGRWVGQRQSIVLEPAKGMIILDLVDGVIACVEILYRDEVRRLLHQLLP